MRIFHWLTWPFLFVLGFFDRDTPLGRLAILPVCILASARSMFDLEPARKRQFFGWFGQYPAPTHPGGYGHWAKNLLTEWVRSDPQRGAKVGSFTILFWMTLALAGWLL